MTYTTRFAWEGRLEAIFVAARAGAPMRRVELVEALEDKGLAGDRYAQGTGAFSRFPGARRQVTLIAAEALADAEAAYGVSLAEGQHRRNLVVSGVPLDALVGRTFRVDEAVLKGVQICAPCKYLVRVTGTPAIFDALLRRGGLRAQILTGGRIRQGAVVHPLDV
jgi:MOSC domain-containing protein YiiM